MGLAILKPRLSFLERFSDVDKIITLVLLFVIVGTDNDNSCKRLTDGGRLQPKVERNQTQNYIFQNTL